VQKYQITLFKSYNFFILFSKNRAVYEIMWKNILVPGTSQRTASPLRSADNWWC